MVTRRAPDRIPEVSAREQGVSCISTVGPWGGAFTSCRRWAGHAKLTDLSTTDQVAWSPDGRVVAAALLKRAGDKISSTIYVIPTDGGDPRAVTRTKRPATDWTPAFSPDGRRLAYVSCTGADATCDVYVLDVDAAHRPAGPPRQLTRDPGEIRGLAWSRDGHSIIYSRNPHGGLGHLWRVAAAGDRPAERLEAAGLGAMEPATVRSRDRLAFTRSFFDVDVYRLQPGCSPEPVVAGSFADFQAQFSPDGRRIAFATARAGEVSEIWVAAADGSGARQLTTGPGRFQGAPHWSPDGRRIAFDSEGNDGQWHIWTIDAGGGPPHQITKDPGNQNVPTWSRDGRTIYFCADGGMGRDLWRVPAEGGGSRSAAAASWGASRPTVRPWCINRRMARLRCSRCRSVVVRRENS